MRARVNPSGSTRDRRSHGRIWHSFGPATINQSFLIEMTCDRLCGLPGCRVQSRPRHGLFCKTTVTECSRQDRHSHHSGRQGKICVEEGYVLICFRLTLMIEGVADLTQRQCRNILIYGYALLLAYFPHLNVYPDHVNSRIKAASIIILR